MHAMPVPSREGSVIALNGRSHLKKLRAKMLCETCEQERQWCASACMLQGRPTEVVKKSLTFVMLLQLLCERLPKLVLGT